MGCPISKRQILTTYVKPYLIAYVFRIILYGKFSVRKDGLIKER
jgi:hypothetical protein